MTSEIISEVMYGYQDLNEQEILKHLYETQFKLFLQLIRNRVSPKNAIKIHEELQEVKKEQQQDRIEASPSPYDVTKVDCPPTASVNRNLTNDEKPPDSINETAMEYI